MLARSSAARRRRARRCQRSPGCCGWPRSRSILGATLLSDAYNLANTTPNIVYELLLGGVLSATLVPALRRGRDRRRPRRPVGGRCRSPRVALVAAHRRWRWSPRPVIVHLYSLRLSPSRRRPSAAWRSACPSLAVPAADVLLRAQRPVDRAAQRPAPLRRRRLRAGAQQPRRDRVALVLFARARRRRHRPSTELRAPTAACCRARRLGTTARHRGHDRGAVVAAPPGRLARSRWRPDFRAPDGAPGRAAVGLDVRLRRRQPGRAVRRATPWPTRRAGDVVDLPVRVHLLPAAPRAARRVGDDHVRARAGARAATRPTGRRSAPGSRSGSSCWSLVLLPAAVGLVRAWPERLVSGAPRSAVRSTPAAPPRRGRRAGVVRRRAGRLLDLPVRAARLLRAAATPARRSC